MSSKIGLIYHPDRGSPDKHEAVRVLENMGHNVQLLDPTIETSGAGNFDLIHMAKRRLPSLEALHKFDEAGIPSVNPITAVLNANDRFRTLQILEKADIPVPAYELGWTDQIDMVPPFIAKTRFETSEESHNHRIFNEPLYDGECVVEDLLDGEPFGGYRIGDRTRVVKPGELRKQGEYLPPENVDGELEALIENAADAMELSICEVDVMETSDGFKVFDVNSVVDLRNIEDGVEVYVEAIEANLPSYADRSSGYAHNLTD